MTNDPNLEPIEPDTAVDLYLTERKSELTKQSLRVHGERLSHFLDWCEEDGLDDLNDLTGRDTRRYKIWRSEGITNVTLKSQMDTLRVFLRWAVGIDAVHPDVPDKVQSPKLRDGENEKTTHIDTETADTILTHLRKYEYASLSHVIWEILWHTGMRRGAARSLDVGDYNAEKRYLNLKHRPDTETYLKNKYNGERPVAISEAVATVIGDWIADQRPDVTDDYGREPLLATKYGRIHGQTIQKHIYVWSRPCTVGMDCPQGRDPKECDATGTWSVAHKCPETIAPHDVRRSSITHALRSDAPVNAVSDRADVSGDVLDKHYDQMTDIEKMDKRRDFFDNI